MIDMPSGWPVGTWIIQYDFFYQIPSLFFIIFVILKRIKKKKIEKVDSIIYYPIVHGYSYNKNIYK
jgi:hypothetical protein